jgi:hypothetical protein
MSDRKILEHYGTKAFQLAPGSIAHAAIEDIRRHKRNRARAQVGDNSTLERFTFLRKHVRKASKSETPERTLITLAIDNRGEGLESGKKETRLVYSDLDLLAGALLMVDARAKR